MERQINLKQLALNQSKLKEENVRGKRIYRTPTVDSWVLEMESGIAAGSGTASPGTTNDEVKSNWNADDDKNAEMQW
ncbi:MULTISPECIES: hypothetical protein [unclassified Sphingobacterium]|uniref:hypothetical protein n=1 Tax=unclassified Sphingobacterium TaxID=2609468 RepID=UPI0025ED6999|nr:hypothetical protein [Sphingobacterium sp. UBA5670]